jgi:prepilin-type N-terminal cleavage/methylation domain-containing protein
MMRYRTEGFTLIEVMAALAVLAGSIFVLLACHSSNLDIAIATTEVVAQRGLIEEAIARSEIAIYAGELTGEEEFGPRFEGYSYSYAAELTNEEIALYTITLTFNEPNAGDPLVLTYLFYDVRI